MYKIYTVQLEIAGPTAIWTCPDTGDAPCELSSKEFEFDKEREQFPDSVVRINIVVEKQ